MTNPVIDRVRNVHNTGVVTTYIVGDTTPITIAAPNDRRIFLRFDLEPPVGDVSTFIRPYPKEQDSIKQGITIARYTLGNDNVHNLFWQMDPDNIMTGEFSAISLLGNVTIYVTEW